jgi:mono/diheme cytochrome c family protein
MRRVPWILPGVFTIATAFAFVNVGARAQEPSAPSVQSVAGSANFDQYCVVCHGKDARGTGPLAATLKKKPADLTELAKRNGGVFPAEMVHQVIDGSKPIKGHGGGDMPEWGAAFGRSADTTNADAVKLRIASIVEFLATKQAR